VSRPEADTFDRIAAPYDRGMAPLERLWLREMRARLLPYARGRVLEIGIGTGANLPFYPTGTRVTGIDESADMLLVAAGRSVAGGNSSDHTGTLDGRPHLGQVDAERLAFAGGTFDTVVGSLVFCSVVEPRQALAEIRRVLRPPGGRLLLLEHMRPRVQPLAWLVDLANVPWYAFNGRCHLNRRTQQTVVEAGFEVERVEARLGGFFRMIVARLARS
jgi:ubiquinone/menaquinone biosynthesis C-methylase UbiE